MGEGSYANGARRFEKNVRFATVDTVKAGWLLKNKGTWLVTDAGKAAFKKFEDPAALDREAVRLYHVWKKSRPDGDEQPRVDDQTGEIEPPVVDGGRRTAPRRLRRPRKRLGVGSRSSFRP